MDTPVKPALTGAALKVRLGGLGLPPSWFADRIGVTMRTVVRWFDGEIINPQVPEELDRLEAMTVEEMRKIIDKIGDDDPVTLRTYRTDEEFVNARNLPASWHRALTFRVLDHLRASGVRVEIEYR
jgi:hypothetical protein